MRAVYREAETKVLVLRRCEMAVFEHRLDARVPTDFPVVTMKLLGSFLTDTIGDGRFN